ncbi:hypothetical protein H4R33_005411, partial [Dimargaris cristalligena]
MVAGLLDLLIAAQVVEGKTRIFNIEARLGLVDHRHQMLHDEQLGLGDFVPAVVHRVLTGILWRWCHRKEWSQVEAVFQGFIHTTNQANADHHINLRKPGVMHQIWDFARLVITMAAIKQNRPTIQTVTDVMAQLDEVLERTGPDAFLATRPALLLRLQSEHLIWAAQFLYQVWPDLGELPGTTHKDHPKCPHFLDTKYLFLTDDGDLLQAIPSAVIRLNQVLKYAEYTQSPTSLHSPSFSPYLFPAYHQARMDRITAATTDGVISPAGDQSSEDKVLQNLWDP